MTQEKKYDVFISYSRKDFDEVNAFIDMLKQCIPTLDIWFDLDGIESGDEFRDKIISAIKRSKYLFFFLSENSDQSVWTRKELQFARGKEIKIIPLLLEGVQLQEMDWFLFEFGGLDCIDITDSKQLEKVVKNLAKWTNKELIQNKKETLWLNDEQETSISIVTPTLKPTPTSALTPTSITVAERVRKEQEEQERIRKEQEEQERIRKEQEEQERLRKEQEEQERLRKEQEEQERIRKEQEEQERIRKEQEEQERLRKEQQVLQVLKVLHDHKVLQEQQEQERIRKEEQEEQERIRKEQIEATPTEKEAKSQKTTAPKKTSTPKTPPKKADSNPEEEEKKQKKLMEEFLASAKLSFNSKDMTAEITKYRTDATAVVIPETVIHKPLLGKAQTYRITSIGKEAFSTTFGNWSLQSIQLPNSITHIGKGAFQFLSRLTSITIPDGVTTIEDKVFLGCHSLVEINLPRKLTSIGNGAFFSCKSLQSLVIPEGVTRIWGSAFSSCESITSLVIPEGVEEIGYFAFKECSSLTSISLPASLKDLDSLDPFKNCDALKEIIIPKGTRKQFVQMETISRYGNQSKLVEK